MKSFEESRFIKEIIDFKLPRYNEIPDLDLYMDQILPLVQKYLSILETNDSESFITSNMINNYVKQNVLLKPVKKKYSRDHIVYLIIICLFKQVFSIPEVKSLLILQQETYPLETAYNYFCDELEQNFKNIFTTKKLPKKTFKSLEAKLTHTGAIAFTNKIYIQQYLKYLNETKQQVESASTDPEVE